MPESDQSRFGADLQTRLERIEASLRPKTSDAIEDQSDAAVRCYTVKETAKILRLGLSVTYANIEAGRIPAVKLGGRWLIPHAGLVRLLQGEQRISTAAAAEKSGSSRRHEGRG